MNIDEFDRSKIEGASRSGMGASSGLELPEPLTRSNVLAVVVSYRAPRTLRRTVEALTKQIDAVHVVDNGSGPETDEVLDRLTSTPGVTVERLGKNLGVGRALNCGVLRAQRLGYGWVLTMDQDSIPQDAFLSSYQQALCEVPSLASLAPIIGAVDPAPARNTVVDHTMTSGHLVRRDVYDVVGHYSEDYFVDCIDFDFCLRLDRAGYHTHRIAGAVLDHALGEPFRAPRLLRKLYSRHSPVRRYYMYRNYLYLAESHYRSRPAFILRRGLGQLILLPLIGLFDTHPLRSYAAVCVGVRDYIFRKRGQYQGSLLHASDS